MKLLNNLVNNDKNKNQNTDFNQRKLANQIEQNNFNTAKKDDRETTPIQNRML